MPVTSDDLGRSQAASRLGLALTVFWYRLPLKVFGLGGGDTVVVFSAWSTDILYDVIDLYFFWFRRYDHVIARACFTRVTVNCLYSNLRSYCKPSQ